MRGLWRLAFVPIPFVVAGVFIFVGVIVAAASGSSYGKVPFGSEARLTLPAGKVIVSFEERANVQNSRSYKLPTDLAMQVRPADGGAPLPLESAQNLSSYVNGSLDGASVWRLNVPKSGDYVVTSSGAKSHPYPEKALAFGKDVDIGSLMVPAGLAFAGTAVLCVVAVIVISLVRRGGRPQA